MSITGSGASIRGDLRSAVTQAMRQRDRQALGVYRSALSAIDNAEAVPQGSADKAGAIEASEVGVGRTEVPRRLLTEPEMIAIVKAEAAERGNAAEALHGADSVAAQRLTHEADLLLELLDRAAHHPGR